MCTAVFANRDKRVIPTVDNLRIPIIILAAPADITLIFIYLELIDSPLHPTAFFRRIPRLTICNKGDGRFQIEYASLVCRGQQIIFIIIFCIVQLNHLAALRSEIVKQYIHRRISQNPLAIAVIAYKDSFRLLKPYIIPNPGGLCSLIGDKGNLTQILIATVLDDPQSLIRVKPIEQTFPAVYIRFPNESSPAHTTHG